jgi:chorismate lyase / 3-hydroxybenzoate synthase
MRPTTGAQPAPRFGAGLHFLTEAALDETLPDLQDRLLGGVAFGTAPGTPDIDAPFLAVPMPLAGGTGGGFEVLLSAQPVRAEKLDGVATARSDEVLFACLEFDDDAPDYEAAVRAAYLRAFRAIDHFGYPHLLRVWNYLPDIHRDRDGLERYRRFSLGRHEAFVAAGRDIARDAPAASAVGHGGGRAALCLLAARARGVPVENPRQLSAWRYPAQYGPRSPTFARALVARWGDRVQLYVSGTASIVGHQSRHPGDLERQTAETIANLQAVIAQAAEQAGFGPGPDAGIAFKLYLRDPRTSDAVETALRAAFGSACPLLSLQADICRRELLLEIEAVATAPVQP